MSLCFVNMSDFMGLVAKEIQEKRRKSFLIFWSKLGREENEEHD